MCAALQMVPIEDGGMVWEQLKGEPIRQFEMFATFRDLGAGRTIQRAKNYWLVKFAATNALDTTTNNTAWNVTASKYHWTERAHLFDAYKLQVSGEKQQERLIAAREGRDTIRKSIEEKLAEALQNMDLSITPMEPKDVIKLALAFMGDSRSEFEKPLEKLRDQAIAAKGQLTIAELVRISRTAGPAITALDASEHSSDNSFESDTNIIDADYQDIDTSSKTGT